MRLLGIICFIAAATAGAAAFWFWFRAIFEGSGAFGGAGLLCMAISIMLVFLGAIFSGGLSLDE